MSRIAVVTDTTQYLPAEVIERHGIHLVSLYVNWNGRTDREIDLPDYDGYYDFLKSAGELPTTSQPSLGDFLAVYEPLIEAGDQVLSIHLSGGISGTVRAGCRQTAYAVCRTSHTVTAHLPRGRPGASVRRARA